MAIIRTTAIVQAISGKVGGTTFAQTKNGIVVKTNPQKKRQQNARTLAQRNRYSIQRKRWQNFSQETRDIWNLVARNTPYTNRLGITRTLNGFQLFMKTFLQGRDFAVPAPAPQTFSGKTAPATSLTLSVTSGGAKTIAWTTLASSSAQWIIITAARPGTTAPLTYFRNWRSLGVIAYASSPIDISTEWDETWGDPAPNETVAASIRLWDFDAARLPSPDTTTISTVS